MHLYGSGERNGTQRRMKVSPTMMHALWWRKGIFRAKAMLNSGEIKPVALIIVELCLAEQLKIEYHKIFDVQTNSINGQRVYWPVCKHTWSHTNISVMVVEVCMYPNVCTKPNPLSGNALCCLNLQLPTDR